MSAPPYMKFFWGDYHRATRRLTRDQHGAYFLLIGEAWRLGGALPDDDQMLAAWALCTPQEWAAMKPIIMDFFIFRRGKWVHNRVRDELASYESTSRKRKEAGKRGGSARSGNIKENAQAIAKQKPTKPEPEPEPDKEPPIAPQGAEVGLLFGEPEQPLAKIDEVKVAFEMWVEMATRSGLPVPELLTDDRRRKIKARLKDGGLEGWARAIEAVEGSAFCRGQIPARDGRKPFRADLTFITQAQSFTRLLEGFYGQDAKASVQERPAVTESPTDIWRRRVMTYRKNGHWNRLEWGPAPGKPGCTVSPEIQMSEGFTPAFEQEARVA